MSLWTSLSDLVCWIVSACCFRCLPCFLEPHSQLATLAFCLLRSMRNSARLLQVIESSAFHICKCLRFVSAEWGFIATYTSVACQLFSRGLEDVPPLTSYVLGPAGSHSHPCLCSSVCDVSVSSGCFPGVLVITSGKRFDYQGHWCHVLQGPCVWGSLSFSDVWVCCFHPVVSSVTVPVAPLPSLSALWGLQLQKC